MLDFSLMRTVTVATDNKMVHVDAGWRDVDLELGAYGLATPKGTFPGTGVAGPALGCAESSFSSFHSLMIRPGLAVATAFCLQFTVW